MLRMAKSRLRLAQVIRALSTCQWARGQHVVEPRVTVDLPAGNLAAYVLKETERWPTKTAVECVVTGQRWSYSEMGAVVRKVGGALGRVGVGRGDVVGVAMLNCPQYPMVLLGALSLGAPVTPINPAYTPGEMARQVRDSGAKVVVVDEATVATMGKVVSQMSDPPSLLLNTASPLAPHHHLPTLLADKHVPEIDPVEVAGDGLGLMPYSSGTTGAPKGVMLSHAALVANLAMYGHPSVCIIRHTEGDAQDSLYCYLPFFHVYGLVPMMLVGLIHGARLLTVPCFHPSTLLAHIQHYKMRVLHLVPPVLNLLAQSGEVTREVLASVEGFLCGAAPVLPSTVAQLRDKMGRDFIFQEGYGMTEVLVTHATPLDSQWEGGCGLGLPNVATKIVAPETGAVLAQGQDGEVCVRSPAVMSGYLGRAEETAHVLMGGGWTRTGDIGRLDARGHLTIVDRTKELIKVKGLQVSPSELEDLLLTHPKVVEAGVVGLPHARLGEAPRAFVVTTQPATQEEIMEFINTQVAPHKRLVGGVRFVAEVPKTATGKLLRRELKAMSEST